FLRVLRWFTSPGSLRTPMYSGCDNCFSQQLGFPIRTSPDHRLLASPRSLSQLATSFIAYLRQGIHTHALSSLTIKLTLDTNLLIAYLLALHAVYWLHGVIATCVAHQYSIVKEQTTEPLRQFTRSTVLRCTVQTVGSYCHLLCASCLP